MLGDFLLATPVFRTLRERFPHARIGVLVQDRFKEVMFHNPHVDELLLFQKDLRQWNVNRIWKLLRNLVWRWDLSVVLNTVSHSLTSDILSLLSGSRYILGSERPLLHGCSRNFLYNIVTPILPEGAHQSARNMEIVRPLGAVTDDLAEEISLQDAERSNARAMLERHGITGQKPVIALHVGAGKIKNRWPVDRFAQLATRLHHDLAADLVLCWGPNEGDLASEFDRIASAPLLRFPPGSIRDLAALFTQCDLVVCNDTGVMHISAAVGTPLVAVFGPTDANQWKPVGDAFVAVQGADGTVDNVRVDSVFEAVQAAVRHRKTYRTFRPIM